MAFVFESLLGATVTLAILYFLLSLFLYYKLFWLQSHSSKGLNTRKLFAMSCLLTTILRCMSFSSMALLSIGRVDFTMDKNNNLFENDDDKDTNNYTFFEKSLIVLFDFPDFCCISAYVLLLMIWAEAFLKSRRHWLSNFKYRKFWMLSYFVFNIILYGSQLALYSLLFLPSVDNNVLMNLIYLTLAAFSVMLPVCWVGLYFFLAIQFAGFPFSTPRAKVRLRTLTRLGILWTFGKLSWGLIALTSVLEGWLTQAQESLLFYSIILVCIFFVTEMIPIAVSCKNNVLQCLADDEATSAIQHSPYQPLRPSASGFLDSEVYTEDHVSNYLPAGLMTPSGKNNDNNNNNNVQYTAQNPMINNNNNPNNRSSSNYAIQNNLVTPVTLRASQANNPNNNNSNINNINNNYSAGSLNSSAERNSITGSVPGRRGSVDSDFSSASHSPNVGFWEYFFGGN